MLHVAATAKPVIGALDKGDDASAAEAFDLRLCKQLPVDKLKQGWQPLAQKYGKRFSIGRSQSQPGKRITVTVLPCNTRWPSSVARRYATSRARSLHCRYARCLPPALDDTAATPGA